MIELSGEFNRLMMIEGWSNVGSTDLFSAHGIHNDITWLLVSDSNLIATPVPAALFMFAPALLGFFGFRRKMQA